MEHSYKGYKNFLAGLGVVALVVSLLLGGIAQSQVISGDVIGTVLDKSGAAVPSATVTALKVDTGTKYTSPVNGAGEFRFGNLPPGLYDISATAPSFATTTVNGFKVDLNRTLTLNITLEVRSATATIEVIGSAPILDTSTPTISTTFEQKQMDLPTVSQGSGVLNLSLLTAGVANGGALGAGTGPAVGGQRPRNNNFTVEGIDNNSKSVTGPLVPIPNDSIQEFTVLQNVYSPEFGHSDGGQFNYVLKSGTNSIHGLGYEYMQNRNMNAMDQTAKNGKLTGNPRFDDNRFGGNIGGPILKNKLFFFGSAQYNPHGAAAVPGAPVCTPTTAGYAAIDTVPGISATNLSVFKQYASAAPTGGDCPTAPLSDPRDGTDNTGGFIYIPNSGAPGGYTPIDVGILTVVGPNFNNSKTWLVKLDYDISPKDQIRGAYISNDLTAIDITPTLPAFYLTNPANTNRLVTINEYHTFNSYLSNEFGLGFNRTYSLTSSGNFNFPGLENTDGSHNFPNLTFDDLNALQMGPDPNGPQYTYQNVYSLRDNFTWVKGRHTLKVGIEARKYISPQSFTQRSRGDYEYSSISSYLLDLSPDVLGERSLGNPVYYGDQVALYWFANDSWRIRPNLTLNYGVRYEYTTIPFGERAQKLNEAASVPGLISFAEPKAPKNNWGPRIGIAYTPGSSGNTSIRAGFAVAYDVLYDNIGILSLPPQLSGTVDVDLNNQTPNFLANGGIPPTSGGIVTFPDVITQRENTANQVVVNQLDPKAITWTLGVQHNFAKDFTAEVRYVGTSGIHLNTQERLNKQPLINSTVFLPTFLQDPGPAALDALPYTKAGIKAGAYGNGDSFVPAYEAAGFDAQPLVSFQPNGHSTYHSLATQLTKRMSHGVQFVGAYTYSKTIDNSTADFFSTYLTPRRTQDFQNLAADRSNSALDHRHRFTLALVYDVPYFKHSSWVMKNLVGNWQISPIYTYQTGQWMSVQSGTDSNGNGDSAGDRAIFNPGGIANTGSAVQNLCNNDIPTGPQCDAAAPANIVGYLAKNPTAQYIMAATYARATAGRNTLKMQAINSWDLSFVKTFAFTERYNLQFIATGYNVFNHAQFNPAPLNDVTNLGFTTDRTFLNPGAKNFLDTQGAFSSNPRTLQLGLRFQF
ncbi:MAG TPA: carboxypeptidase regulatory-like domain-containing protein [Candidatus Limnocylindrales bacterium]|nr:carboxypeptidase regulatory-like domain-containing protein [Candidatus Limnocylindrales bacterium]